MPAQERATRIRDPPESGWSSVSLDFSTSANFDLARQWYAPACPTNLVGPVDLYLVAHHGGPDAADPATFAAFRPRVAVVNNGPTKGGAPELLAALRHVAGLDVWQLHRSTLPGGENFADDRIANIDESASHWIQASARVDGSFTITNGRTGVTKSYPVR